MLLYKGVLLCLLLKGCLTDWTQVKHSVSQAVQARQAVQEQLVNYQHDFKKHSVWREFLEAPLPGIYTRNGTNSLCVNQTVEFLDDLISGKAWAMSVLDSFGKPLPGILQGNVRWTGSYRECTRIRHQGEHMFLGQYCTAALAMDGPRNDTGVGGQLPGFQLGFCVADLCTSDQLEILMNKGLSKLGMSLKVSVSCQPNTVPLDTPAIAIISLLSILGFILLAASLYDVWLYQPHLMKSENRAAGYHALTQSKEEKSQEDSPLLGGQKIVINKPAQAGVAVRLLLSFSMYTNGAKILDTSSKGGIIPVIHGVRFLSLSWVILGHTIVFALSYISNVVDFLDDAQNWYYQIILNATVAVDTFFLLSGLLVSYLLLQQLGDKEKPWKNNWLMYYFHRFWRLTPACLLILGTYTALFKYWGSGPFWPGESVDTAACTQYWWRNLLYVQNLFPASQMCLGWSWYLAIDMQYYILSPLLVLPYIRSKWLGFAVTAVFLSVQVIVTVVTVVEDKQLSSIAGMLGSREIRVDFMEDLYFKPWIRFGPYGVGIIAGYIMYATKRRLQMHALVAVLGWCVATAVALAVVFGTYEPAQGHLMTRAGSAMYNAFHSSAWAAAVAWLIIACDSGYGGFVNWFLCWKAFVPLSRLTYMAYLIHPIIMYWCYLNEPMMLTYTGIKIFYWYLGHLVLSYSIAAFVSLAFESPMMGLEKLIFHRDRKA